MMASRACAEEREVIDEWAQSFSFVGGKSSGNGWWREWHKQGKWT